MRLNNFLQQGLARDIQLATRIRVGSYTLIKIGIMNIYKILLLIYKFIDAFTINSKYSEAKKTLNAVSPSSPVQNIVKMLEDVVVSEKDIGRKLNVSPLLLYRVLLSSSVISNHLSPLYSILKPFFAEPAFILFTFRHIVDCKKKNKNKFIKV